MKPTEGLQQTLFEAIKGRMKKEDRSVPYLSDGYYDDRRYVTLRSYQVYRHELGARSSEDVLVYDEADETFSTRAAKTKCKRYLLIYEPSRYRTERLWAPARDGEN